MLIYEYVKKKDDKLLKYFRDTTKKWFTYLGWSLPKILQ